MLNSVYGLSSELLKSNDLLNKTRSTMETLKCHILEMDNLENNILIKIQTGVLNCYWSIYFLIFTL